VPRSPRSRTNDILTPFADALLDDVGQGERTGAELAHVYEVSLDRLPNGFLLPIDRIETWDRQPRKQFNDALIDELAASIRETGLIEPIIVRRDVHRPGYYVVIAGHRRLLACRRLYGDDDGAVRARMSYLTCIVREVSDDQAFADALVENLVRTDLTRRETMEAILRLQQEYNWTGYTIAKRTGRNESDISILLRVARHRDLAELVYDELISPTAAGVIERLDDTDARYQAITLVRTGQLKTVEDVTRYRDQVRGFRREQDRSIERDPMAEESRGAHQPEDAAVISQYGGMTDDPSGITVISQYPADQTNAAISALDTTSHSDLTDVEVEEIPVSAHTRRVGASTRAEALARDMVTFSRQNGILDRVAIGELEHAQEELTAYLSRQKVRSAPRGRHD